MTASVPTWNKGKAPGGSTGWLLTPDIRAGLESMNVITPVADQAERDALTPPLGKYAGMAVCRLDRPNMQVEIWDGSAWQRNDETGVVNQTDTNWGYNGGLMRQRGVARNHVQLSLRLTRIAGGSFTVPAASMLVLGNFIPAGWYPSIGAFNPVQIFTSGSSYKANALLAVSQTGDFLLQSQGSDFTLAVGDFINIAMVWHAA